MKIDMQNYKSNILLPIQMDFASLIDIRCTLHLSHSAFIVSAMHKVNWGDEREQDGHAVKREWECCAK